MLKFLFRIGISLLFLGLLFYVVRGDIPEITHILRNIDKRLCGLAVAIYLSTQFILAYRLKLIFAAENIRLKFLDAINLTFVGFFFNNFLPTSVGGDIVKAFCAARVTGESVKSASCVLIDRVFGLFTFILIPSVSLFFLGKNDNPAVPTIIYSFLGLSILFFVIIFNRGVARRLGFLRKGFGRFKFGEALEKVYDRLHNFKNHKIVAAKAMGLSVVGQTLNIFVLYLLAIAIGSNARIIYFYLLVPVVHLLSMLPSLNGLGIRESAYIYFLKPHVGKECAAAIGVLWLGLLLLSSLIGGIIYLVRHDYHIRFKSAVAS